MLFYPSATRSEGPLLRVNQASRSRSWHSHRRRQAHGHRADGQSGRQNGDESGRLESGAGARGGVGRRALQRRLARTVARIEKSDEYRRSLGNVAQLAADFQQVLDARQLGRWLSLEEALHEHAAWLSRVYFYAGAAGGELRGAARAGATRREPARAQRVRERRPRSDAEVVAELADLLLELLGR